MTNSCDELGGDQIRFDIFGFGRAHWVANGVYGILPGFADLVVVWGGERYFGFFCWC